MFVNQLFFPGVNGLWNYQRSRFIFQNLSSWLLYFQDRIGECYGRKNAACQSYRFHLCSRRSSLCWSSILPCTKRMLNRIFAYHLIRLISAIYKLFCHFIVLSLSYYPCGSQRHGSSATRTSNPLAIFILGLRRFNYLLIYPIYQI